MRSILNNSMGLQSRPNVLNGNLQASRLLVCSLTRILVGPRLVLTCLTVLSVHAYFVVEQPRQSHLFGYYRWQWLQEKICYVPWCHACMSDIRCRSMWRIGG